MGNVVAGTKPESASSSHAAPGLFYGYVIVLAALTIWMTVWGASGTFGIFFKSLSAEFGWGRTLTAGAFSLNLILSGFLGIIMGRLSDRFGPTTIIPAFGAFLGLGYLLMSQIGSVWQFYFVYGMVISIGVSPTGAPIMATVARWFVKRRGLMTGIVVAGVSLGQMIMPPLAGKLIGVYDWRLSYVILGGIVLVFIVIPGLFLKRDPAQVGQFPYGAERVGTQQTRHPPLPLVPERFSLRQATRTRQFWLLWVMFFCFGFARSSLSVHLVPFITDLGFSLSTAAAVVAAGGVPGIIGRVAMGAVADRIGNKQAIRLGFILMAAALFWLLMTKELWMLFLFMVVFSFSWGALAAIRALVVAEVFGVGHLGAILGAVEFGATVGGAAGPLLAGWIFDISSSYHLAFMITAGLAIAGAIVISLLRPTE